MTTAQNTRGLPWRRLRSALFAVRAVHRYVYDEPVRYVRERLIVNPPPEHGDQRCVASTVTVSTASTVDTNNDHFGNVVTRIAVPYVVSDVEFVSTATVERSAHGPLPAFGPVIDFLEPTPLTKPDGELAAVARTLAADSVTGIELAQRIGSFVHRSLTYQRGATRVTTTASQAWSARQGVCQDLAHVTIALCRLNGLPARYVSGLLASTSATSHAWVEVAVEREGELVAIAIDPTHDRRPHLGYITVAVGRDYADVAPTQGTYVGGAKSVLTVERNVEVLMAEAD
jgi:transglutaminase-like putative cysteine protease